MKMLNTMDTMYQDIDNNNNDNNNHQLDDNNNQ